MTTVLVTGPTVMQKMLLLPGSDQDLRRHANSCSPGSAWLAKHPKDHQRYRLRLLGVISYPCMPILLPANTIKALKAEIAILLLLKE